MRKNIAVLLALCGALIVIIAISIFILVNRSKAEEPQYLTWAQFIEASSRLYCVKNSTCTTGDVDIDKCAQRLTEENTKTFFEAMRNEGKTDNLSSFCNVTAREMVACAKKMHSALCVDTGRRLRFNGKELPLNESPSVMDVCF